MDDIVIEQLPPVRTAPGVYLASEVTSTPGARGDMPVVFLHAGGFSRGVWRPVARRLAGLAPGIALDLRGHGNSSKPEPPYFWSLFAADVSAYLEQLPAGPIVLCGHSMGGATAVEVAAQLPERIAALALVEPVLRPPSEGASSPARRLEEGILATTQRRSHTWPSQAEAEQHLTSRSPYRYWDREVLAGFFGTGLTRTQDGGCTLSCPPGIEASMYAEAGDSQAWSRLPQISCPVGVLRASGDQGMASTTSPRAAQVAQDGVDRLVEGSGHFVPMEQPWLIAAFVREMLTELQGRR